MPRFNTPVCITFVSYRKRLCDPDGISYKAAIDGLVKAGVLADDSPKEVKEIKFRQIQSSEEKTVIEVKQT